MPTVSRAPFSHSRVSEHEPRERRCPQYLSCSIVLLQLSLLCDIRRFVLVPSRITLIDPYSQHGEEQSVDQQQQPRPTAPSGAWTLPWKWQGCPSISTPTSHVSHDTDASSLRCQGTSPTSAAHEGTLRCDSTNAHAVSTASSCLPPAYGDASRPLCS